MNSNHQPTIIDSTDADIDRTREHLAEQGYRIVNEERTPDGWRLTFEVCGCDLCRAKRNELD
ncbi:MAG: hypothetical protein AB9869_02225 [Verrucomicrobiia bacterium]